MNANAPENGKTLAVVAYITIIGVLIAFFMNQEKQNKLTAFHVRQSLGLWLLYFILGYVISGFDSWMLTYSFWIFFAVLFVYGILGAVSGKLNSIPILGDVFQKIFKSLGN
ncbi:hypothetical protein [Winogradskyella alexanderae]|uniref:DUF4870 domain-containing protein n=1 Tax=Winogradskyella alexanderae TaxID=2877123 RepID=A0ABS7XTZ2_9FLAO|nr:hypothetical protein [Winogradskyella alexanderae]MCA0133504.1 hypothetical protein [Winogradskyella alexanderae]